MSDIPGNLRKLRILFLRILPLLICVLWYISTDGNVQSCLGLSICAISSFVYCLGVVFKNKSKTYSISEGALLLVMIQLSIIAYVVIEYFEIKIHILDFRVIAVILLMIMLLIAIFKAFVIIPKFSDDTCDYAPNVDIGELTSESRNILSTIESIDVKEREIITYGCICLLKDYIHEVNKSPKKLCSIGLMSDYMPTQNQIVNYPFESLSLLLSAQKYIMDNYIEDKYCNFQTNLQIIDERLSKYKQ